MSGTIPPEFGIFVRNFENFTSNRFKLEAQSGTTGAPGNIVSVLLSFLRENYKEMVDIFVRMKL